VAESRKPVRLLRARVRKSRSKMTSILTGQLILGTDKRNPLFTVYAEEEDDQERLHVYYGLELLEVVSADRNDPSFKMLVGRLHNAGVSLRVLQQTFQSDAKTIQRWGRALRSRDAEELIRVLEGRRASRKLGPEIKAYVRARWPDLMRESPYGIGKRLRQEIQRIFGVKLSQETLRPLLGELKQQPSSATPPESSGPTTAEGLPQLGQNASADQPVSAEVWEKTCDGAAAAIEPEPAASWALAAAPQTLWCDHLGLLLLAPVLVAVAQVVEPLQALFKQWLASLFLGALNIEQTKFLNWPDLSRLLGEVVRFPHPQRQELERVATQANLEALARFNAQQIGAESQNQFYFDPHTKHYTGEQNVLEGWCAAIRWADKAMHSDFIHTVSGEPLYFETTDNFADLRQRFFEVVQRCRQVMKWPEERVLTFVVDRAIFGKEVFEKVLADPALHLITWEKGYSRQEWPPPGGISGSMVIERARNRADDLRSYHLEYWDRTWPKDERLRQIVVQATHPKGRVIQVSILTDDAKAVAIVIIGLMFGRWVQENDFKYLDKHFGINQITSYGVTGYEELRQQVGDRQVRSAEAKALLEQRRQLRARQSRLLLVQTRGEHEQGQRQQQITELEKQPDAGQAKKALARLRQGKRRWERTHAARQEQIQKLSRELAELDTQGGQAPQTESRLEGLIAEKMVRLDPEKKRLMDCLRVIARNVFYQALQPFKKAYNNYRDDHGQFRQLTQASGVLEVRPDQIVVHLMPRVNYPPRVRRILATVLEGINAQAPVLPDGSGRRLKLRLAQRSEMKLSIEPSG
jgi:transposase